VSVDAPVTTAVLLANGASLMVRPLVASDHDDLIALHRRASDTSIYKRFFSCNRSSADTFVETIVSAGPDTHSLVAVRHSHVVGVATAIDRDDLTAEVALLVDESMHGMGIGSILLEHLARAARARGVRSFVADVLTENIAMLRVFHDLGFVLVEQRDHEVLALSLDITPRVESVEASDARARHARRASLRPLFEPRSVAVVGVSRRRGGIGREVVENLLAGGYAGELHAVGHPDLRMPLVTCLDAVADLPPDLDLAVVAAPPDRLAETVEQLGELGTHVCVVLTSGLAETGADGASLERRVAQAAREHDMRLVGPNCFGVLSNLHGTRLDATFGRVRPTPGALAVGSQSGGVGIALLDAARARGLGVATFVSLGNKADVSGNDLLSAWQDDPEVRTAALYLESFHDPRAFARLAARFSRSKPLLVVFGGSSAAGLRAGASHTAAHATPARALRALYQAAGVVEVEDLEDLVDTAALCSEQPLPRGGRLGVLSNAGGLGILAADAAQRRDVEVPALSDATRRRLRREVPGAAGVTNPVDLGAGAAPDSFAQAAQCLAASGEVDTLLVITAATAVTEVTATVEAVESTLDGFPELPCLSVVVGEAATEASRTTRFRSADTAVRSLAHVLRHVEWRRSAAARVWLRAEAARTEELTPVNGGGRTPWLGVQEVERLLDGAGVRSVPHAVVRTAEEVASAVAELGTPLVAKTADPSTVHKTEAQLVRTGLRSVQEVTSAVQRIRASAADPALPVLLQQQVSGPELAFGVTRDPTFGPLLMLASGGTSLDLWDDQVFLMPPLGPDDVREALASLRTWPLVTGFRGAEPLDAEAVVQLVVRLGRLVLDHPEIEEMDLNPVIVTPEGPVCVDAKVRAQG